MFCHLKSDNCESKLCSLHISSHHHPKKKTSEKKNIVQPLSFPFKKKHISTLLISLLFPMSLSHHSLSPLLSYHCSQPHVHLPSLKPSYLTITFSLSQCLKQCCLDIFNKGHWRGKKKAKSLRPQNAKPPRIKQFGECRTVKKGKEREGGGGRWGVVHDPLRSPPQDSQSPTII